MKRLITILFFGLLITACSRAASVANPTAPALDFPTVSPDSLPLCQADELTSSSNSSAGADTVVIGITLTNISKHPCALSNPPQISLLDSRQSVLQLQQFINMPVQTSPIPKLISIAPDESMIITIIWKNFCIAQHVNAFSLALDKGQNLQGEMKQLDPPSCLSKTDPSTISIVPYSSPP